MLKRQFFLVLFVPGLLKDITSVVVSVVLLFVAVVVSQMVVLVVSQSPLLLTIASCVCAHVHRLLRDNEGEFIDVTEKDIKSKGATEFELIKQVRDTQSQIVCVARRIEGTHAHYTRMAVTESGRIRALANTGQL